MFVKHTHVCMVRVISHQSSPIGGSVGISNCGFSRYDLDLHVISCMRACVVVPYRSDPIRSDRIHPATSIARKYHRGYDRMPMDNGGAHRASLHRGVMETRNAAGGR